MLKELRLQCYACGKELGDVFLVWSMQDMGTDRAFFACENCKNSLKGSDKYPAFFIRVKREEVI